MRKFVIFTLFSVITAICSVAFCSCSDDTPVQITSLKMNYKNLTMSKGETMQLQAIPRPETAPISVKWTSSNDEIVSVNTNGLITCLESAGSAIITARAGSYSCTCSVVISESSSLDVATALAMPMSSSLLYSSNIVLPAPKRIMQGFDVAPSGKIYYSQISSDGISTIIACASGPNQPIETQYMDCRYFGHATQIVAEENADGKTYIWLNSNGNQSSSGEYENNYSVSRVEYQPGAVLENCSGKTFFLNKDDQYDQQVSIDFDNRRLLIGSRKGSRYFYIFDLDEVLSLPEKTMTVTTTVEGTTSTRTVQGYDLNDCKLLGYFSISAGSNQDTDVYSYSHQGHEVYGDYVYFYEGNAVELGNDNFTTKAYLTVFDYTGSTRVPRTEVTALSETSTWKSIGLTTTGWSEPESLKIRSNGIYLGVASRDGSSSQRRANILYYPCKE